MSTIGSVLKQEIARLAKREAARQTRVVRKAAAQHRRDIAELKRLVHELTQKVRFFEKQEKRRAATPPPAELAENARFSPQWVKSHRKRLELSGADYARLVGVSTLTIYNWESGKSKPRKRALAALVRVRDLGKREALRRLELMK